MDWPEALKVAGGIVGLIAFGVPIGWAALRWWGSSVWVRREEFDQVTGPLEKIVKNLETLSEGQAQQATCIARVEEGMKGLGKSVDDLRGRVERQEDREVA